MTQLSVLRRSVAVALLALAASASAASAAGTLDVRRTAGAISVTGASGASPVEMSVATISPGVLEFSSTNAAVSSGNASCTASGGAIRCSTGNGTSFTSLSLIFTQVDYGATITIGDIDDSPLPTGATINASLGDGNDVFTSYADAHTAVDGWSGDDTLETWDGDDTLTGWEGDDYLDGADGDDELSGGNGRDVFASGADDDGSDVIDGGAGRNGTDFNPEDVVSYRYRTQPVTVHLVAYSPSAGNGESSESDVLQGIESVIGGSGDDVITGMVTGADPLLVGLAGNDTITGSNDDDTISGGPGADTLRGGNGSDEINADDASAAPWNDDVDLVVDCGNGSDVAFLDDFDPTPISCENTDRQTPAPTPPPTTPDVKPAPLPAPVPVPFAARAPQLALGVLGVPGTAAATTTLQTGCTLYLPSTGTTLRYAGKPLTALALTCDHAVTGTSQWTLTLTPKKRKARRQTIRLARKPITLAGEGAVGVQLTLTAAQKRKVRQAKSTKAALSLSFPGARATTQVTTKTFKLKS